MSDELDFDEINGFGMIKSILDKHRSEIAIAVFIISMFAGVIIIGFHNHEQYQVTGKIIEIRENSYIIQIKKSNVYTNEISKVIEVSEGICQSDSAFANAYCRLGVDVIVIRYINGFDDEFWYIYSVKLGEIPHADINNE